MSFIDARTYYQPEMWKHQGKSYKWLRGYDAAFNSQGLPSTASPEYAEGYQFGLKDKAREELPPNIRDGFGYGHGYKPDCQD